MGFKNDFYSLLLREVSEFTFDLPEKSRIPFLADQLLKSKRFAPNSAVALISDLNERFEKNLTGSADFYRALLDIAINKKIRIQEGLFNEILSCRDLFAYSDDESCRDLHSDTGSGREYRLFYKRTAQIRASMEGIDDSASSAAFSSLRRLSGMLRTESLVMEAKAWLYDAGYSLTSGPDQKPRKIDRSVQLIDEFFKREDSSYTLSGFKENSDRPADSLNEQALVETKQLFDAMDPDPDYSSAVIPVAIDANTGTGLYIYGIESDDPEHPVYLKNEIIRRRASAGHYCYYTIFEYCGSHRDTDRMRFPGSAPGRLTYHQYITNEGSRNESVGYIDLEDAVHDYKEVIRSRVDIMFEDNTVAPAGCPERFRQYFYHDDESGFSDLDERDIALRYSDAEADDTVIKRNRPAADSFKLHY